MKIIRNVVLMTTLILLISITLMNSSLANDTSTDEVTLVRAELNEDTISSAIQFRELHGIDSSDDFVRNLIESNYLYTELEQLLGFPLTNEEMEIISQRNKQQEDSNIIREFVEQNYNDIYAGSFFNSKDGSTTIFLTEITNIEFNQNIDYNDVTFEKVDYSLNQLVEVRDRLTENAEKLAEMNVNLYSIDEGSNRVIVYSGFDDEVDMDKIGQIVDLDKITFKKANFKPLNSFDLELGEHIQGRSGLRRSQCSSGFFAQNNSSQDVLVTAGHCNRISIPMSWYRGNSTDDFIGNFHSKVVGEFIYADSSTILLTNNVNIQPRIGSFNLTSINNTSEGLGNTIYYKGYVSGANFGSYNGGVCILSGTHPDPDVGNICDQGMVSNTFPSQGDSGGVVFTVPIGARLHGTVTGGLDTNNDGVFDTLVYSKIGNIVSELNLSGIYIVQ
ncbi:hypothetical protein [Bacillus horti]|uniref:Trypsin-like serine protease n=1 Tax=Caldalkalibacillus horti TaxID=77523 RepID=A0ABT9W256_9BACI|nr:hypothetical protein [Bacillus horti]MDQ0167333.1 hypothetical protein [Bacillus horti]